jgi:alpha-tubulin suppressor-like RCC1 family protein
VTVSAGLAQTCGTRTSGTLWCWGANGSGQLGLGDFVYRSSPTQAGAATDWKTVATGSYHTCGVRASGALWCWGYNTDGQVGNGASSNGVSSPVRVGTTTDWRTASAGGYHTCGVRTSGTLWCWGNDLSGQVGDGAPTNDKVVPTQVGAATEWKSVELGGYHTCGVRTSGTLWCWGSNGNGQLGIGMSVGSRTSPTQVGTATDWWEVSVGTSYTVGMRNKG